MTTLISRPIDRFAIVARARHRAPIVIDEYSNELDAIDAAKAARHDGHDHVVVIDQHEYNRVIWSSLAPDDED